MLLEAARCCRQMFDMVQLALAAGKLNLRRYSMMLP